MSQARTLLNNLTDDIPIHDHIIKDTDSYFVIDPDTREITNVSLTRNVLMQFDHNSEVYTFETPRFVEGHDMTLCNRVRVHFINVSSDALEENADVAELYDLGVSENDPAKVICSWTIARHATQLAGTLNFLVQYECIDDSGETVYEWHSDIYTDVEIRKSINNSEQAVIEYSNVLEQWYQRLFGAGDSVMADIEAEGNTQLTAINEAGATQLAAINDTSTAQKESIARKGEETLATIPADYTEVYNMADEALRTKADAIMLRTSGEAIFVDDASDDYVQNLKLFGKTTQFTTTGAQIAKYDEGHCASGVTKTFVDDVLTVTGDGTMPYQSWSTNITEIVIANPGKAMGFDYEKIETAIPSDGTIIQLNISKADGSKEYIALCNRLFDKTTYIVPTDISTISAVSIAVYTTNHPTSTANTVTITKPMLHFGTDVPAYEPYTGGAASPNPEFPQELESVENVITDIYSGQLLNVSSKTSNAVELVVDGSVSTIKNLTVNRYGNANFNQTFYPGVYTIAADSFEGNIIDEGHLVKLTDNDTGAYITALTKVALSSTFALDKVTNVKIEIYAGNTTIDDFYTIRGLRIYYGAENRSWEPYVESQHIALPYTLNGIPVSSGGNYTDGDGQQWICDEVDFDRGVYVKRIGVETFDGSDDENWYLQYKTTNPIFEIAPAYAKKSIDGLCTHYSAAKIVSAGTEIGYSTTGSGTTLRFRPDDFATITLDEWKSRLTESPVTATYILATPIEIPLTEEEIAAFRKLKTNYHNTTVMNDSGAHIEMDYVADTTIYIRDNQPYISDERVQAAVDAWLTAHYPTAEGVSF